MAHLLSIGQGGRDDYDDPDPVAVQEGLRGGLSTFGSGPKHPPRGAWRASVGCSRASRSSADSPRQRRPKAKRLLEHGAGEPRPRRVLGGAPSVLGRLHEARRLARRALEFSSSQPGFTANALHLLGDIAHVFRPVRWPERRGQLPPGLGPCRAAGHAPARRPLPPRSEQAPPAHRQPEEAHGHLTIATTRYREVLRRALRPPTPVPPSGADAMIAAWL